MSVASVERHAMHTLHRWSKFFALSVVALWLASAAGAVRAQTTTIDFDTLPNGTSPAASTTVTNQWSCRGATFSGGTIASYPGQYGTMGKSLLTSSNVTVTFASPTGSVRGMVGAVDNACTLRVYDAQNNDIGHVTKAQGATNVLGGDTYEVIAPNIVKAVFEITDASLIDNVVFDSGAIGDCDSDGTPSDSDACDFDPNKIAPGACGCGNPDTDGDSDGTADCVDACPTDSNKVAAGACGCNVADADSDGDSALDCNEMCPNDPAKTVPGPCGCGMPETDDDSDTIPDCTDACRGNNNSGDDDMDAICNNLDDIAIITSAEFEGAKGPCTAGGVAITIGVDRDASQTLSDSEKTSTHYACSGGAGASGATSLVLTDALEPGNEFCANGGVRVRTGIDDDHSGALEPDRNEVDTTEYVCNGTSSPSIAVRTKRIYIGAMECPAGGEAIETGIDDDKDGTLDDDEVQNSEAVCEAPGLVFDTKTLGENDDACPHGGLRVAMGHDDGEPDGTAGDEKLQSGEVEFEHDICLAPTDVIVNGGSADCTVAMSERGTRSGAEAVFLLLGALWFVARRRRTTQPR